MARLFSSAILLCGAFALKWECFGQESNGGRLSKSRAQEHFVKVCYGEPNPRGFAEALLKDQSTLELTQKDIIIRLRLGPLGQVLCEGLFENPELSQKTQRVNSSLTGGLDHARSPNESHTTEIDHGLVSYGPELFQRLSDLNEAALDQTHQKDRQKYLERPLANHNFDKKFTLQDLEGIYTGGWSSSSGGLIDNGPFNYYLYNLSTEVVFRAANKYNFTSCASKRQLSLIEAGFLDEGDEELISPVTKDIKSYYYARKLWDSYAREVIKKIYDHQNLKKDSPAVEDIFSVHGNREGESFFDKKADGYVQYLEPRINKNKISYLVTSRTNKMPKDWGHKLDLMPDGVKDLFLKYKQDDFFSLIQPNDLLESLYVANLARPFYRQATLNQKVKLKVFWPCGLDRSAAERKEYLCDLASYKEKEGPSPSEAGDMLAIEALTRALEISGVLAAYLAEENIKTAGYKHRYELSLPRCDGGLERIVNPQGLFEDVLLSFANDQRKYRELYYDLEFHHKAHRKNLELMIDLQKNSYIEYAYEAKRLMEIIDYKRLQEKALMDKGASQ